MSSRPDPARDPWPDPWAIQQDWHDANGRPQRLPDATVELLKQAIGVPPQGWEQRIPVVTGPGRSTGLGAVEVTCEDGTVRSIDDTVPDDFPLGYHRITAGAASGRRLIVSPGRCWLPEHQEWGWAVQLYGARSRASWGIGDLADLGLLREWTDRMGGGFLLINPLHAVALTPPSEASPYLPATRRFRNPVYLRVDDVPGYDPSDGSVQERRRLLNDTELIDRDAVWELKREALAAAFASADTADARFVQWRAEQGEGLESFATWAVLVDEHGPNWRTWPEGLRHPGTPEVAAFRGEHTDEVTFQAWLQWQLDVQLRSATGRTTVIQDLPIGVSGSGSDAWAWQDVLADAMTVGAPPDMLNSTGQDWGSPPLVPWRLQLAEYEPFIDAVRGTIAGAGGLRIDHVMGLFRLWWIPQGHGATEGGYVGYPAEDLLDIVALESHRARAIVVGEDLGVVGPGVREALTERNILSYKVLWFEDQEPRDWPPCALGAVTTHDLPTVAGLWTGSDAEDALATTTMTHDDVHSGRRELLGRLRRHGLAEDASVPEAVDAAYGQLGQAPSLLLSVALEDAVLQEHRPNVPGTVERSNWRVPLPLHLEELVESDEALRLARRMDEAVRSRRSR
ncbi:4-alpha-glucanotransferase [Nocardioides pacificus]